MSLSKDTLTQALLDLLTSPSYPVTLVEAALNWANVYSSYAASAADISGNQLILGNTPLFASTLASQLPADPLQGTPANAAQAFETAFIAFWMGAQFGVAIPAPGFASTINSTVTIVAPGVLSALLLPALAGINSSAEDSADAWATAFHTATTTAVTILVTGITPTGVPITMPSLVF